MGTRERRILYAADVPRHPGSRHKSAQKSYPEVNPCRTTFRENSAQECTGRFKKVIGGSFIMVAVTESLVFASDDPVAYTWSGEGSLKFKQGS
jgi:hypothetical protein